MKFDEVKYWMYLKGFMEGVMIFGNYKGKFVKEVKLLIR